MSIDMTSRDGYLLAREKYALGDFEGAIAILTEIYDSADCSMVDDMRVQCLHLLGCIMSDMERYDEAVGYFKECISRLANVNELGIYERMSSYVHLATIYNITQQYHSAIICVEDAARYVRDDSDEFSADLEYAMGQAYMNIGETESALEHIGSAVKKYKVDIKKNRSRLAVAYYLLAELFDELAQPQKSARCHEIVKMLTNTFTKDKAMTYLSNGNTRLSNSQYSEAVHDYMRAIKILHMTGAKYSNELATLYVNLGCAFSEMKSEKAISCYKRALAINKELCGEMSREVGEAYCSLGEAYRVVGRDNITAVKCLKKAKFIFSQLGLMSKAHSAGDAITEIMRS